MWFLDKTSKIFLKQQCNLVTKENIEKDSIENNF